MSRQATKSATAAAQEAQIVRSQHLDASLEKAHRLAMSQHHSGVTLEHLLFALTEDPEALLVLGASTIDVERLRADITTHLGQLPNDQPSGKAILPTNDLLKVLKLAATAAQQSARRQMDGAIVMAAIIGDASTPSAGMLRAHGLNFQEVIRVLQKSATPPPPAASRPITGDSPPTQPVVAQPAPKVVSPAPAPVSVPAAEQPAPSPPQPMAASQPADEAVAPGGGLRPTTDELLASVRARLNATAPTPPRRFEPTAPVEPVQPAASAPMPASPLAEPKANPVDRADPPTVAIAPAREEPAVPASTADHAVSEELAAPVPAPVQPPAAKAPAALPTPAAAPTQASASPASGMRPEWPRSPADLVTPPVEKLPWAPSPLAPPPMPADRAEASPVPPRAAADVAVQPPLPLVPSSAQRSAPPPLPLPTVSAPPASAQSAPPRLPPTSPAAGVARDSQRPPPIPPPTVDLRALVQTLPRRLRESQTDIIEIVVPRRTLEIPPAAGHRWPPIRVATLRLKADPEDAHVELASPESLWISPPRVHQGADDAIWRWRVTPRSKGRIRLSLAAATRIVGSEGISAEVPLGEEFIDIDVARRGSRRGLVGLLLFGNLLAIGFLAMVLSGRAAETVKTIVNAVRGLIGGG